MTPEVYIAFVVAAALLIIAPGPAQKSETYSHSKPHCRGTFGGRRGDPGRNQI